MYDWSLRCNNIKRRRQARNRMKRVGTRPQSSHSDSYWGCENRVQVMNVFPLCSVFSCRKSGIGSCFVCFHVLWADTHTEPSSPLLRWPVTVVFVCLREDIQTPSLAQNWLNGWRFKSHSAVDLWHLVYQPELNYFIVSVTASLFFSMRTINHLALDLASFHYLLKSPQSLIRQKCWANA